MNSESHPFTGNGGQVVHVPGILAHSQHQVGPLVDTFNQRDLSVIGLDYCGTRFDPHHAVKTICDVVEGNMANGRRTIPFGSSLGGMLTALALNKLVAKFGVQRLNESQLSVHIVDAPSRGKDLVLAPMVPSFVNPVANLIAKNFQPKLSANDGYGKKILETFRVPPKDGEIELVEGGLSAEQIKQRAIAGLSDHFFTMWYGQVQWMLNTTLDLSLLAGLDITYYACIKGNVSVHQPQALRAWKPYVRRVVEVETPHCAYLQAQPTWTRVLSKTIV